MQSLIGALAQVHIPVTKAFHYCVESDGTFMAKSPFQQFEKWVFDGLKKVTKEPHIPVSEATKASITRLLTEDLQQLERLAYVNYKVRRFCLYSCLS